MEASCDIGRPRHLSNLAAVSSSSSRVSETRPLTSALSCADPQYASIKLLTSASVSKTNLELVKVTKESWCTTLVMYTVQQERFSRLIVSHTNDDIEVHRNNYFPRRVLMSCRSGIVRRN